MAEPHVLPSLRREIARALLVVGTVWLLLVFAAVAYGVRHEVDDLMDDALQEAAELIYGLLVLGAPDLPQGAGTTLPAPAHDERLVWQIVDQNQAVLWRSHKAPATALLPQFGAGFNDAPGHWRVYAMRLPDGARALYVAQQGAERLESRYESIAVVAAAGLLVSLLCAWWLRQRLAAAMAPLETLSEQITRFDPMRPDTGLPPPARQEFVEVRQAIVELGRRLARRVASEQAFAAHAAHALRTPLAGMEAQLAVALKEAPESVRPRLQRSREAVARLKRVVTSLLALFRSHAAPDLHAVNLAELVMHLGAEMVDVRVEQDVPLRADPNLLAAALANLLDNACRHGAHACWIRCGQQADGATLLTVSDDGPGASPERLADLRHALDQQVPGDELGLGLKLVSLVARAHGGHLSLDSGAAPGGGFCATMVLWQHGTTLPGKA